MDSTGKFVGPVAEELSRRTGLVLSKEQLRDLEAFLRARLAAAGLREPADYLPLLDEPAEFRGLVDRLTVRETFFYRHEAQFDAFFRYLVPELLARAGGRRLRLWSAGCCTGEEPYTLALMAAEEGLSDRVELLATDINENYLEEAMAGLYSRRSVEKLPPFLLEKYFKKRGSQYQLSAEIRAMVTFRLLNLAGGLFPSPFNGTAGLDAVFCRNVLIYFEKRRLPDIVRRFADCVGESGVVALGHSEMLPHGLGLAAEMRGEAFFYRPRAAVPGKAEPQAEGPGRVPEAGPARRATRPQRQDPVPRPPAVPAPPAVPPAETPIVRAEKLADAGRAAEAAALCREVLKGRCHLDRAHYLLGLLSLDSPAEAIEHFRRTVYLNPSHLQARLHLAQCAAALGRPEAAREYRALERLASARPPGEVLDPAEGITCGMLAQICRAALERRK